MDILQGTTAVTMMRLKISVGVLSLLLPPAVTAQTMNDYTAESKDNKVYVVMAIATCAILLILLILMCFQSQLKRLCKKTKDKGKTRGDRRISEMDDAVELEITVDDKGHISRPRRCSEADRDAHHVPVSKPHPAKNCGNVQSTSPTPSSSNSKDAVSGGVASTEETPMKSGYNAFTPQTAEDILEKSARDAKRSEFSMAVQQPWLDSEHSSAQLTADSVPLLSVTPATPVTARKISPVNAVNTDNSSPPSEKTQEMGDNQEIDSKTGLKHVPKPRDFYATPTLVRKMDSDPLLV